jgi:hypothetical protein
MIQRQDRGVVAWHREADEWALIVEARRNGDGRRLIVPHLFVMSHCTEFISCPVAKVNTLPAVEEKKRDQVLRRVVEGELDFIHTGMQVLEESRTGIVKNFRARNFGQAIGNFSFDTERFPIFKWLHDRGPTDASIKARQVLRLARFLAEKHGLHVYTQGEAEEISTKQMVGADRLKEAMLRARERAANDDGEVFGWDGSDNVASTDVNRGLW